MSGLKKWIRIAAAVIGGSVVVAVVAGGVVVRTDWFRNMVRSWVVTGVDDACGCKCDWESVAFDWRDLRAQIRNFVIHGLEPAGGPPLFQAKLLQVDLKVTPPFKSFVDLAYLLVDTPQANVILFPDGRTNIPAPKIP